MKHKARKITAVIHFKYGKIIGEMLPLKNIVTIPPEVNKINSVSTNVLAETINWQQKSCGFVKDDSHTPPTAREKKNLKEVSEHSKTNKTKFSPKEIVFGTLDNNQKIHVIKVK